jgi:hypothetical protein
MESQIINNRCTESLAQVPGNLPRKISSLLVSEGKNEAQHLYELRLEFERFIHHLSVLANITKKEWDDQGAIKNKIQLLASNKVDLLKEGVEHYLNLWYGLGCIGAHIRGAKDERYISLRHHVDMCLKSMLTVMDWYVQEFPPLSQNKLFIETSRRSLEDFNPTSLQNFVKPTGKSLVKILENHELVVIHGPSWIGKTSLSCFSLSNLVEDGALPVVFHERNLISPSSMLGKSLGFPDQSIKRLSLKDKSGILHEQIVTGIFRGDSFAILFDDPFGHRNFKPYNSPLAYLRISDWVKLAREHTSLGAVKVIISTPSNFWDAVKNIKDDELPPIFRENLAWILDISNNQVTIQELTLNDYSQEDLELVVENVAKSLHCKWLRIPDICSLLAGSISETCKSFDILKLFCLETQNSTDEDEILNAAEKYFEKSPELSYKINDLTEELKVFLVTVYLSEAFEELSKDYIYTRSSFKDFCNYLKVFSTISSIISDEKLRKELDYWVNFESEANTALESFPKFRHPDIRAAIEIFVRQENGKNIAVKLLKASDFTRCFTEEVQAVMRWESTYVLCHCAHLLDQEICETINDEWFLKSKAEFDFNHTLWALSDNWLNIKGSFLESFAIGALKRIQHDFPASRRNFIWEVLNNWTYMPEDIRYLVIKLNAEERAGKITSKISDYHLISFLGGVFCNYRTLTAYLDKVDSESTRLCLDFANNFVQEISKEKNFKTPQYKPFEDDRVFSNRGATYSGKDILVKLRKIGLDYGGLKESEQLIRNIEAVLFPG